MNKIIFGGTGLLGSAIKEEFNRVKSLSSKDLDFFINSFGEKLFPASVHLLPLMQCKIVKIS